MDIEFTNTRSSRGNETIAYDVAIANIATYGLLTCRCSWSCRPATESLSGQPATAFERLDDGSFLVQLETPGETLGPGQTTDATTVVVAVPGGQRLNVTHDFFALPLQTSCRKSTHCPFQRLWWASSMNTKSMQAIRKVKHLYISPSHWPLLGWIWTAADF